MKVQKPTTYPSVQVTATAFLSWEFSSSAKHTNASNTGVPYLLVDVISVNNAWYHDKESASGTKLTFVNMVAEYTVIVQEVSNLQEDSKEVHIASYISRGKI